VAQIRVVTAEGRDPTARGRQIGRGLGDLIEGSIAFYNRYFERRGIRAQDLRDFLAPHLAAAESHLPLQTAIIKGMAEGAMVPFWQLFAVNAFEELEPLLHPQAAADRCSSFSVQGADFTLLGHNEQWLAGDLGNVAVVIERPGAGSPVLASPTIACCLSAVGMNEFGCAQAIQSLVASDDGVGVPRALVSRHSLEASDRLDAVRRADLPGRAGGYGHVFAFGGGDTFMVETSAHRASVLEGPGPHTNHYLDPDLAALSPEPSKGSMARYDRLMTLLEERRPSTPPEVMDVLRDHESSPQAICLHAEDGDDDDAETVLFSVVCHVESRRIWVAAGPPCSHPFEEIDLSGVM
jgi:isopenicillin-N N-acyltransferase-like protein